jgi:UDPglucose 6-dehydrogenase/GDP-mannose 6-dehydrogenase
MKISIIGAGYVGLVSSVCLAEKGHQVTCVDVDQDKIDRIKKGISPIYERGLEDLLKKNIDSNLHATTELYTAVTETDLSLIAVGTPFDGTEIDLSFVEMASQQIGNVLQDKRRYHVVVVKSTVVPGTTDEFVVPILEKTSGKTAGTDFGVGMNPEFLREGEAVQDFMFPDRIVLGGIDKRTIDFLDELYGVFDGVDKVRTNNKTAEMIKYTSNALLATMISFSNEIANICSALGDIDVVDVMKGVHLDKRISPILPSGERILPGLNAFLEAGCGFGGSCFPKDVKAFIAHGKKHGRPMRLLDAVMHINEEQPKRILSILKNHFSSFEGLRVAVLGLAFKPGTDDMRESPAIPIIRGLLEQEALIRAYDPVAKENAQRLFSDRNISFYDDLVHAIRNVHAILLITRWEEFKKIPDLLRDAEPAPLVIDGRRMLDKHSVARYGGIGL